VAREFLGWLAVPPGRRWLDVGCGTGALSQTILDAAAPAQVTGVDTSEGYVAFARAHVRDARVRFRRGDAQALPAPRATSDVAVSGLMLNFVPEPARAVAEMARVTCGGGTVAAYVWDYAGEMQLMRHFWDAAVALTEPFSAVCNHFLPRRHLLAAAQYRQLRTERFAQWRTVARLAPAA
jgi:ubiquinone/menaquinone biosynthesis C-methylase UbiE